MDMPKFNVTISQINSKLYQVEAKDEDEAIETAIDQWKGENFEPDIEDVQEVIFRGQEK